MDGIGWGYVHLGGGEKVVHLGVGRIRGLKIAPSPGEGGEERLPPSLFHSL